MPDVWTAPSKPPVFNVGTVLLLTDGTLFAQDDFTTSWWRLRPDNSGDYSKGVWTQAASARQARRYFASAVLADGRVFVAGGKTMQAGVPTDLLAAEIYDPVTDRWEDLPVPAGWNEIGNAPCCVLPNGTVLLGNITTGACAIYDPDTNAWRPTGSKLNLSAGQESWTLLQDGSVLTVNCVGNHNAERYVGNVWQDAGALPNALIPAPGRPIGPAVLLPNGTVFATGDGATAIYNPALATPWAAGPALQNSNGQPLSAADGPACLLPDGSVLFVARVAGRHSVLLTYNGATVVVRPVQPQTAADVPPEWTRLLLLPNGQVLFATSRPELQFLTTGAIPDPTWAPEILQVPRQFAAGQTYILRGRRLNGMSQACVFGDDAGMATNYPLVRLRQTGVPTPTVTYCRTSGHSTMGVGTGNTEQFTSFTVPAEAALGSYELEVVANGIASQAVAVAITAKIAPTSGTSSPPCGTRDTARDLAVQEEMFWRDLNEVHLLMDFISGRADTSLLELKDIPDPGPSAEGVLTPQDVLRRVCLIRFPPVGSPDDKADQAALLLMVKDKLNALAFPAKGLSIAFTALFARMYKQDQRLVPHMSPKAQRKAWQQSTGFALEAYPNLDGPAANFRFMFKWLPYFTLALLLFTALISWDVVLASQTLQKADVELGALPNALVNDMTCSIKRNGSVETINLAEVPPTIAVSCQTLIGIEGSGTLKPNTSYAARIASADILLGSVSWWHPVGGIVRWFERPLPPDQGQGDSPPEPAAKGSKPPASDVSCGALGSCARVADMIDTAESVINVFSNNILPMLFGLLGTFSGLMRSITAKVRDSTLSPRDYRLSLSLIPMGVVAGLTAGLIISPNAGSSIAGTVGTLSATALAFLAGYGVEYYFNGLDIVLMRIFPTSTTQAAVPKQTSTSKTGNSPSG